jgi:hypothetical protein
LGATNAILRMKSTKGTAAVNESPPPRVEADSRTDHHHHGKLSLLARLVMMSVFIQLVSLILQSWSLYTIFERDIRTRTIRGIKAHEVNANPVIVVQE